MARVHKVPKKGSASVSLKSRAARRATSPSIDTDKSLKEVKPPSDTIDRIPSALGARRESGISKKKNQKPLSRQQRLRKEKGIARADVVIDKLEKHALNNKKSSKNIKDRAADWEDLNASVTGKKKAKKDALNKFSTLDADDAMGDLVDDGALGRNGSTQAQKAQHSVSPARFTTMGAFDELNQIT